MYAGDRFRGMGLHLAFYRLLRARPGLPHPVPGPVPVPALGPPRCVGAAVTGAPLRHHGAQVAATRAGRDC